MVIWKGVFYPSGVTQWDENEVLEKQNKKKGHKLNKGFVLSLKHIKALCL